MTCNQRGWVEGRGDGLTGCSDGWEDTIPIRCFPWLTTRGTGVPTIMGISYHRAALVIEVAIFGDSQKKSSRVLNFYTCFTYFWTFATCVSPFWEVLQRMLHIVSFSPNESSKAVLGTCHHLEAVFLNTAQQLGDVRGISPLR